MRTSNTDQMGKIIEENKRECKGKEEEENTSKNGEKEIYLQKKQKEASK